MDFVDRTLVRLAAEETRADLLSSDALREVLSAAYDLDAMPVTGPYSAQFDELLLGYAAPPATSLEGGWSPVGTPERVEAQFRLMGLAPEGERIDALWRGAVVARTAAALDHVESVESDWPNTDAAGEHGGVVQVTYTEPATGTGTLKPLPVVVAMLVRDAGFSVADLLARSQALRERLRPLGLERPADPALKLRHPIVVAWIVPAAVFEDEGWPGAEDETTPAKQREARRAAAAAWLAREGIGLLTIASTN